MHSLLALTSAEASPLLPHEEASLLISIPLVLRGQPFFVVRRRGGLPASVSVFPLHGLGIPLRLNDLQIKYIGAPSLVLLFSHDQACACLRCAKIIHVFFLSDDEDEDDDSMEGVPGLHGLGVGQSSSEQEESEEEEVAPVRAAPLLARYKGPT